MTQGRRGGRSHGGRGEEEIEERGREVLKRKGLNSFDRTVLRDEAGAIPRFACRQEIPLKEWNRELCLKMDAASPTPPTLRERS